MPDNTKIEWTDATWNPLRGCTRVSEGCRNCYAEGVAARFSGPGQPYEGLAERTSKGPRWTGKIRIAPDATLRQPFRWKRPRRIFVNSMSDLFHESVPDTEIDRIFAVMALCHEHIFQVLTKRPERMRAYVSGKAGWHIGYDGVRRFGHWEDRGLNRAFADVDPGNLPIEAYINKGTWPLPNVWLGTSVEDQAAADARIPHLLATPAAVRFLSCEPLLGPVRVWTTKIADAARLLGANIDKPGGAGLDWVIVGGESGPNARPMYPNWARRLRDQCATAGVPFFFKQWGEWWPLDHAAPEWGLSVADARALFQGQTTETHARTGKAKAGRLLDGIEHNGMPA
jgi:protein gp37